jgi:SAM-dependent methyltransferase
MEASPLIRGRRAAARLLRRSLRGRGRIGLAVDPLSRQYGYDRGTPIDRVYMDRFLRGHGADIRGRVLDIGDDENARRYGAELASVDVLSPEAGAPGATVIADLETGAGMPRDTFDCVLLLETLNLIFDQRRAVAAVHDALKPGGVVLATVNGIAPPEPDWTDYWRPTATAMRRLFEEAGFESVTVATWGNVLAASAYLYGVAAEELTAAELDHTDPGFDVSICLRAQRRAG